MSAEHIGPVCRPADLPLASIIVPVYNGQKYLRESLDSILAQSYPRTEILVLDDASTDGTPGVLAAYGESIHVYRQPRNRGIYGNANDGIAMARGEYVAVYHADDVYMPTIVEREVEFLERYPDAGAVFCKEIFIDPEGREIGRLALPPEVGGGRPLDFGVILNTLLRYKNVIFCCPSAMVRASVYRDVGVYRDQLFRNTSDMEMWLRIARNYAVGILDEYLLRYRHFHDSSSERYHHLRTEPERYFGIMDLYLEDGGRTMAEPDALAAHEAHRAEDRLMLAVNHYIREQREEARAVLASMRARQILGSPRIHRVRLFILFLVLRALVRLPWIPAIANFFYRRWHARPAPRALPRPRFARGD